MAFADFFARFFATSGDTTIEDKVSTNTGGTVTFGSDGDGEYLSVPNTASVAMASSFDPDSTGCTVALLFKKQAMSNFFHMIAVDKDGTTFGGDGFSIKHQSATDLRVQAAAASSIQYQSFGTTAVGDLIGVVMKIHDGYANPRDIDIWRMGASHTGNDPDYTLSAAWGVTQSAALSHVNFNQSSSADFYLYAMAVWDELLSDADCRTLVESLYDSIRSGTLGGAGGNPAITSVGGDNDIAQGESAVIVGTDFEATQGTGGVIISPTDNIADGDAVAQTETAWGASSITFTANFPTGVAEGGTAYVFVTNDTGDSNASGFAITRQDITAPALSSPTAGSVGTTVVTPSVSSNEGSGVVYTVVVPDGDAPSVAQIMAGQQSSGAAAIAADSQAVSGTGTQTFAEITGLSPNTAYELFFAQEDAEGNDSSAASVGFTTDALATITVPALKNNTGTAVTGLTGLWARVAAIADGTEVAFFASVDQEVDGTVLLAHASMVAATDYIATLVNPSDGARHVGRYTAA